MSAEPEVLSEFVRDTGWRSLGHGVCWCEETKGCACTHNVTAGSNDHCTALQNRKTQTHDSRGYHCTTQTHDNNRHSFDRTSAEAWLAYGEGLPLAGEDAVEFAALPAPDCGPGGVVIVGGCDGRSGGE